jgi:pimeloyl-ACP methyl ester carboxylesterase
MATVPMLRRCLFSIGLILAFAEGLVAQTPVWEQLPPTPELPKADRSGFESVNGVRIWYAVFGKGSPVIFVHGGMGNSNYWGQQVRAVARAHQVIVLDSRGHGRSARNDQPITYHLMATDVLALMDALKIQKAALVGWSDGGDIGLDIAITHPERLTGLFAFGANSDSSGVKDPSKNPAFQAYLQRTKEEYQKLAPVPADFDATMEQLEKMWNNEPHFTDDQLRSIKTQTWIVDGDRDEVIKRENTDHMATLIPGAGELILPQVSHFAVLQDPAQFNEALLRFLSRL